MLFDISKIPQKIILYKIRVIKKNTSEYLVCMTSFQITLGELIFKEI